MMEKLYWGGTNLRIEGLFIYFLFLSNSLLSQGEWYKDLKWELDAVGYKSTCEHFYNFLKNEKDSVLNVVIEKNGEAKIFNSKLLIFTNDLSKGMPSGKLIVVDTLQSISYHSFINKGQISGLSFVLLEKDTIGKVFFLNGKKQGLQTQTTGDLRIEQRFNDGLLEGCSKVIDLSTGLIIKFASYKRGKQDGLYFSNHKSGILEIMLFYKKGQVVDGTYRSFYSDGSLRSLLQFENGELIGEKSF